MRNKILKSRTADGKIKISINIPKQLLEKLDLDRETKNYTRSLWFVMAAMEKLQNRKNDFS